ncbi:MAG: hypothetical protein WA047_18570 [Phenylobacterium sp.]|uniref:hypothetical protein n=1 Tax=Phenylobacterium sp. TaxID=1871053 RepID=UPI003BB614DC
MSSITSRTYPPGFVRQVREQIARVIETSSAHDVPSICRRYGIGDGEVSEAFAGKFKYVNRRLQELGNDQVIEVAQAVSQDEGDPEIGRLLDSIQARPSSPSSGIQPTRRAYYSERNGIGPAGGKLELAALITLFKSEYTRLEQAGYFAEHFGFWCVDEPDRIEGTLGADLNARMLFSLNKADLWPIDRQCAAYSEDDLFSVIEYLFDHVTKPIRGTLHSHADCGMHWETFTQPKGQEEFRTTMNVLLDRYGDGWELSSSGEIMERAPTGTEGLLATSLPHGDSNIQGRVQSAITKFRKRQSTADDRRDAVRDLADTLEYLRPQFQGVVTKKDEGDLFNIANNFGIRHHNAQQKTEYDTSIWLSWMFYFYLATIHAVVRFIEKAGHKIA